MNDFYNSLNTPDLNNLPGLGNEVIDPKDILGNLVSQALNGGVNLDVELFSKQLDTVQQNLEKVAEGLCRGFTFGSSNPCKGLPVPFNRALLAPGDYHILGCIPLPPLTETIGKGVPIFAFPTIGPINIMGVPVPPFRPINFYGAGGLFELF
jgi:hypothetical protein